MNEGIVSDFWLWTLGAAMVQTMAVVEPLWHIGVDFPSCGCMSYGWKQ